MQDLRRKTELTTTLMKKQNTRLACFLSPAFALTALITLQPGDAGAVISLADRCAEGGDALGWTIAANGDFNGDGTVDVATGSLRGNSVNSIHILAGDGQGSFLPIANTINVGEMP